MIVCDCKLPLFPDEHEAPPPGQGLKPRLSNGLPEPFVAFVICKFVGWPRSFQVSAWLTPLPMVIVPAPIAP